jgi:hypothetical protein
VIGGVVCFEVSKRGMKRERVRGGVLRSGSRRCWERIVSECALKSLKTVKTVKTLESRVWRL